MTDRNGALAEFLDSFLAAMRVHADGPDTLASTGRIAASLAETAPAGEVLPNRRAVCSHLAAALAPAKSGSPEVARVAAAFEALEPSLAWKPRHVGGPFASDNWPEGHANALIVGPGALEDRGDVMIGASLLAPDVRYPDHDHGPEEVYLVLTPGRFQHGTSDWFEPGVGGTFYNEPAIRHAMASGPVPLLALWGLWSGGRIH